ncbi:MAG: DUF2809 domain-containing protein [Cyanosarcina radialis HA8281-LM2]|jgi:hypothetical protein|nr:DUF2809 domain-containing protein [Cyanosarcina radialis HA8281-LM2]
MKLKISDRQLIIVLLPIVTLLGLLSKSYSGFGSEWVKDYSGDILYEVFWCLFIFFLFPRKTWITQIAVGVFGVTCVLELLQLWHPLWLQSLRSSLVGRTILGTTFSWWDFPHYGIGSAIGWWCLNKISDR